MTTLEIYRAVLQELQQQQTRTMTPHEFVVLFNTEQQELIYTWSLQNDLRHRNYNEDIMCLRVVMDGNTSIGNLAPLPNIGQNVYGKEGFELPEDFLYSEDVFFEIECHGSFCHAENAIIFRNARYMKRHEINSRNIYTQGSENEPAYTLHKNLIVPVIRESTSIVKTVQLTYIRKPVKIEYVAPDFTDVEPGYSSSFYTILVKGCVNKWLQQTGDARLASHTQLENNHTNKFNSI